MLTGLANLNGELYALDDSFYSNSNLKISVFDRSFIYGDSLYEVIRTYKGIPFELDHHLTRLTLSAEKAMMDLKYPVSFYKNEILRTIKESKIQEAYCRIIITRGIGKIGFGLNSILTDPQFVIYILPLKEFQTIGFENGLHLQTSTRIRNDANALDPAMKSGNYLNSLLAYLAAVEKGFHDAILCNKEGHVTEGTTFNVFYVKRGIVATPPLDIGILDGITRKTTIQICKNLNIPIREVRFSKTRLYEADEIFITSTIKEVFPVTKIDDKIIHIGNLTRKLNQAFKKYVLEKIQPLKQ